MAMCRLKTLTVGVVATLILSWAGPVPASDRDGPALPSRTEPLRIDTISTFKRMVSPNSQFKGKDEKLPRQGGLILIYNLGKNRQIPFLHWKPITPPGTWNS